MNPFYCVPLNLDLKLFKSSDDTISFIRNNPLWASSPYKLYFRVDTSELSDELLELFEKHNQQVKLIEVFYVYPNAETGIHTDGFRRGDFPKLNFVFGGEDSTMNWWKISDEYKRKEYSQGIYTKSLIEADSIIYEKTDVDFAYSKTLSGAALIQAGSPHNIVNKHQDRFCVSFIFADKTLKRRLTMREAIDKFKEYNVVP